MKNLICPVVDDKITQLYQEIKHDYPQQCDMAGFTPEMCARWVGSYNDTYDKPLDFLPDKKSLIQDVETKRNKDGKSFLYTPYSVTYNLPGQKQQTYTIIGSNIYNKEGKVVYPDDSNHRRRIFANLAVQQGRAVVVTYRDRQYVVNNKDVIMSASGNNPGKIMQWGEDNGDRKEILRLSQTAFREKEKVSSATAALSAASEESKNTSLPGSETKINIYAGTGENADLSNFAERPFVSDTRANLVAGKIKYFSVEQAFQLAKFTFVGKSAKDGWQPNVLLNGELMSEEDIEFNTQIYHKILNSKNSAQIKHLGSQFRHLDRKQWDAESSKIMKALIKESFEQNPQALQRLLSTGNATLTHTQDKGKWGKEFPKLLMEVRSELSTAIKPTDSSNVNTTNQQESRYNISHELDAAINSGKWSKETIDEFNNYIKTIKNEKIDIEQRVGEGRSLSPGRSEIHEGASLVIGTNARTNKERRGNPQEEYASDAEEGREQERRIESWAKANDLWLNDYEDAEGNKAATLEDLLNSQWDYLNIGSEAEVYRYDGNTVLKSINLSHANDNPGKLLDRIALFNILFPSTAMEVVGFGRDSQGHFRVIATQPYIEGNELTEEDLDEFHKKYKLQQIKGWFKTKYPGVLITDLSPSNIKKDKDGNYYIIDADVKYDESIADINPALEQFMRDVDLLASYYEGVGRVLKDDLPNISDELNRKLADYFMGGQELTLEDYRNLWKTIEFYDDNGERRFRERKPSISSSSLSPATSISGVSSNGLSSTSVKFGEAPSVEAQAEAQRRYDEKNAPTPEIPRPKSATYESALTVNDSKYARFKRTFSPQQIKDRGAMISGIFSRLIDEYWADAIDSCRATIDDSTASEEEKDDAKETLYKLLDPVKGRQYVVEEKKIDVLLREVKDEIQRDLDSATEEKKVLWQNTLDYFEELFNTQATLDIEEREGIRIVDLEIKEQTVDEDENDESNDGDEDVGNIATGSDGWNYKVRYEDPFSSLSKKVRGMLYDIERPDSEKDDLGNTRNYSMGQIYASLLSYLSANMQNPDDFLQVYHNYDEIPEDMNSHNYADEDDFDTMYPNGFPVFPVLEKMKSMYPWVEQVIQRLTDDYLSPEWNTNLRYPSTGGAMASQFYTTFRKPFIPYGKVQIGENKFGITPLNYQMEDRVQLDKLQANYNNRMILSPYSLYNADGKINRDNARHIYTEIDPILEKCALFYDDEYRNANPEEFDKFIAKVSTIVRSFGIDATQDAISAYLLRKENGEDLYNILSDLQEVARKVFKVSDNDVDTFNYMVDVKNSYGRNMWSHFFDGRGIITDASYMQSFYDSASHKTKYSYSADNYLMKKFRGVCMGTQAQRRAYIDKNFGKYEWFKNQKTGEWRNKWLEFWYNYEPEVKEIPYRNIDNITEYGKDGEVTIRPYMKWEPGDILEVQNRSYAPEKYDKKTAYYLAPIFSDSPMSMTILGPRMSMEELLYGYVDDNNIRHRGAFLELINQEMVRIQLVQQREEKIKKGELKEIANFDGKRGKQFCFMPELNTYTFEATDRYPKQTFLERMVALKEDVKSGKATMMDIERHQIQAVTEIMNRKMQEYEGKVDAEQYYNMTYGNISIIQMTTVDLAFYKDNTDFQKRFKEVYAGGIELNTNSKYGMKYENVLLIADDVITSPSYTNIAAIIDGNDNLTQREKDDIKETFMNINVADAQAIRSMYSFRSVLDMMGNWDDRMEQALNNFKNGVWDKKDFNVIYQTIKPFAYSVIERNSGNGDTILVPQQHKNSEICALMMYDLIANGLNDSPVYKAVSRFMDETLGSDGKPLIHMIQYESAGKVGNQGVINISFNPNKVVEFLDSDATVGDKELEFTTYWDADKKQYLPNDLEHAEKNFQEIKKKADFYLDNGEITQKQYSNLMQYLRPTEDEIIDMLSQAALVTNPDGTKDINTEVVHTMPFDNYYQQQPTPAHHVDAEAMIGSQSRNVIIADLPEDFTLTLKGKGSKTYKGRDAVIDFLYELMNENLLEDFFGKGTKTGLKGLFESKESLGEAVKEIVRGNPKYGSEFAEALTIDEETGNFVLSPNSPTIFPLMQEIITSFFKNRITKQKMNGAALIQAAGIGLDDNLRLEFDDKGNCIGAHCLMPLTSKKLFEPLLETQIINGKEVKVFNVEVLKKAGLDKAVGYRIPTENKSSMMPLIIDGFTPLQNGSAIVLPAEITNIAGSDFDVDKMYVLLTSFYIQEYNMEKAQEAYEHETAQKVINAMGKANIADIDMDEIEDEKFKEWFDKNKDSFKLKKPRVYAIKYDFSKSPKENGRKARNNMVLQIMYNILTSKEGSQAVMNPQGFPDVEHASKVAHILTDEKLKEQLISNVTNIPGVLPSEDAIVQEFLRVIKERYPYKYEEYAKAFRNATPEMMQRVREEYIKAVTAGNKQSIIDLITNASTDELKQFIDEYSSPESPIYPQTFIHSHAKNMAGMLQIGIYAIQGSMAEKYQRANVLLKQEQQFTVNDKTVSQIDISEGGRRVKNVNQMVGASADNGKKPNLTDMGSTTKTAPIIGYMLRAGLSHLEAALIINQPYMMLSGYKSGASSKTRGFFYKLFGKNPLTIEAKVTTDMLIRSLLSPYEITQEEDMAIAALCFRILCQHEAQEYLTRVSRADSPNGALKHSYAKARVQRYNVDLLQAKMSQPDFPFFRIREALSNNTIDTTASEDVVREQLKGQKMGLLYGMYSLGIQSFHNLVSPYFFGEQEWFDNNVVKPILYNLGERLTDEQKENVVENIYKSYITYFLSSSPLFGDEEVDGKKTTLKEKREFYLKSFPTEYQKILQENEDIRKSLGSILQVNQFGNRKRIVLQDVGSLSKGQKKDIQRRFEDLAYSDNEVARKLVADLLIYSYFDNGLQFTHDSFSSMFTTGLLINFKPYTEALNELDNEIPAEDTENFIRQFLATFPRTAVSVDSIIKRHEKNVTIEEGAYITMHLSSDLSLMKAMTNVAMSKDIQSEGANFYPYIMYNESVYILDKDALDVNPSELTYIKLPSYSTFPRLPLFNRNMSVAQMAAEFPLGESSQQSQEQPDNNPEDVPMSHNEGSGNPEIKPNSMFEEFEGMDDFIPDFDPGDLDNIEEVNPSDTYKSEGEQKMQKPFCDVQVKNFPK